jgi:hypothetical protein
MPIDLSQLKQDIENTPDLLAAAQARNFDYIVDEYSKPHNTITQPEPYMINKRVLYAQLGMVTILPTVAALEAQSQDPDPIISLKAKEVLLLLNDLTEGGGVDISHPESRALVDELVLGGVMAQGTGDTIKSWGEKYASIGFVKFGEEVSLPDVVQAMLL